VGFLQLLQHYAGIESDGTSVSIPGFSKAIGAGKNIWLDAANGGAGGGAKTPETATNTLPLAYAKLRTGKHDKINLIASTSSLSLASAFTWSANLCHLVGEGSFNRMNQRSRIGHSANFTPMMTISGYGNSFQNLYLMHGRGSATNLVGVSVTGARNAFSNVHFAGPGHATEGDTAGYKLVNLAAAENYFKSCVFGIDTVSWDDGYAVYIGAGGDNSQRVIFEDCLFFMNAAASPSVYFLGVEAGIGEGSAIFLNCHFINTGTALTYAIAGTGLGSYVMYFDNRCSFVGCTDIVEVAYEAYVYCGGINMPVNQVNTASSKLFNMMATNPDVS
jgi:hypothetical protein